jgi:tetratricopeptide (TPR) repeat protein
VDHVKLFLNHPAHRFEHRIHEQILGPIRRNGGDILMTDIRIIHKNHDHSFEGQKRKLERDLRILHLEENDLPTHPFTMFNLGMTYSNKADRPGLGDRSDLEKAKHYLHRALQFAGPHDSTTPPCYALLVSCHRRLGEEEQAWYICNKGLGKFPLDHDLRYRKAMMLRDQGGPSLEQAVKVLRDILDRPEARHMSSGDYGMGSFLTRHALAEIHVRLGQWKEAEAQWRRAVKEVPEFEPGWHNLALALHEQKNWETAESTAREMIGRPQRRVQALGFRLLAHSLGALGRVEEARSCWRSLLQLVPTDAEALQRLNGQAS